MNTFANEFAHRYHQLIHDHKPHNIALDVLEREYECKFDVPVTFPPTYFFIDNSAVDWKDDGWEIYTRVK